MIQQSADARGEARRFISHLPLLLLHDDLELPIPLLLLLLVDPFSAVLHVVVWPGGIVVIIDVPKSHIPRLRTTCGRRRGFLVILWRRGRVGGGGGRGLHVEKLWNEKSKGGMRSSPTRAARCDMVDSARGCRQALVKVIPGNSSTKTEILVPFNLHTLFSRHPALPLDHRRNLT